MANINAFYIVGTERTSGVRMDLAKFFSRKDAEAHTTRYERFHDVRVETRTELAEQQHEAHRFQPAPAASMPRSK